MDIADSKNSPIVIGDKTISLKELIQFLVVLCVAGPLGGFLCGSLMALTHVILTDRVFDRPVISFWILIMGFSGACLAFVCVFLSYLFLRHYNLVSAALYCFSCALVAAHIHMFWSMEVTAVTWFVTVFGYWFGIALLYFKRLRKHKRGL